MRRKWVSLAAALLLCWIFGVYRVRSQTRPAVELKPSTRPVVASMPSSKPAEPTTTKPAEPAKPLRPGGPERALHFHSEITLHDDFSLTVTESIRVIALGRVIKRGICRNFTKQYQEKDGKKVAVPFKIVALLKNGKPEPYRISDRGWYRRVYMGKKDVLLEPGVYTYTLVYCTWKKPENHDDGNELRWNIMGEDWAFDTANVSARIKLPESIPLNKVRYVAHTGDKDAADKGYRARIDEGERICFTTTRELGGDEDLTISLTWAKTADKQSTPLDDTTQKAGPAPWRSLIVK